MQSSTDFGDAVLAFGEPYADGAQASLVVRPSTGIDGDWGKGTKPLETLPAQWWNWFNKEYTKTLDTRRNTVINILTELDGILGLANITPDGTSGTQMSSFFYGDYLENVFAKWLDEEAQDIGTLTANDTAIIPIVKKKSDGQTPPEYSKTLNQASLQQLANMLAPYLPTPPAGDTVPVGTMYEYAGILDADHPAPDGWMQCDGRSLLKTDYPALYDALGDYWGSEDSAHFNIPDMREAVPVGTGRRASGVANHDEYSVGQFKDDQFQRVRTNPIWWFRNSTAGAMSEAVLFYPASSINSSGAFNLRPGVGMGAEIQSYNAYSYIDPAKELYGTIPTDNTYTTLRSAGAKSDSDTPTSNFFGGTVRAGTVTRGKRIGINYIIKF